MSDDRPAIPRPLERELFIEAGYRCAIPTCRAVSPLTIDHIEDWAKVQEHKFENMIVLCANCHGRKGNRRGQIDRTALRQFKANLALLNSRYGEFERRVIDYFKDSQSNIVLVPGGMEILVHYLVSDGYLLRLGGFTPAFHESYTLTENDGSQSEIRIPSQIAYRLTRSGREFIGRWQDAEPLLDEAGDPLLDESGEPRLRARCGPSPCSPSFPYPAAHCPPCPMRKQSDRRRPVAR
jgi:HNH endonuclease